MNTRCWPEMGGISVNSQFSIYKHTEIQMQVFVWVNTHPHTHASSSIYPRNGPEWRHSNSNEPIQHPDCDSEILFSTKRNKGSLEIWLIPVLEQDNHKRRLQYLVPKVRRCTGDKMAQNYTCALYQCQCLDLDNVLQLCNINSGGNQVKGTQNHYVLFLHFL